MPVYAAPRLGVSQSEALREAYASARAGVVELVTIALYHPAFDAPVYCVNDTQKLVATLESTAPEGANKTVEFMPIPFRFTRPEEADSGAPPEVGLEIDNVSRELMPWLKLASLSQAPIEMIVRIYLNTDTTAPHENPPMRLVLRNVSAGVETVSARAGYGDLINQKFPRREYTRESFPGLVAG